MSLDCRRPEAPFDARRRRAGAHGSRATRASGTSATPATSCGWCCGASRRRARHRHRARPPRRATGSPTISGARGARAPTSVRELLLALTQVVARPRAGRRRDRCSSVQQRWRRLGIVVLAGPRRRGALRAARRACSTCPDALPGAVDQRHLGGVDAVPSLVYRRGRGRGGRDGREAVARSLRGGGPPTSALVALGAGDGGRRERRRARAAARGRSGAPSVRPCSSSSARRTGARRRRRWPRALPTAVSTLSGLTLERADGGRSQLYVADRADGDRGVREGVRRATAATPTCSTAATARSMLRGPNDRLAVAVARARRRARGAPAAPARAAGGVTCPAVEAAHDAARRLDGARARVRRRSAARRAGARRDRRPTCSTRRGARSRRMHAAAARAPVVARRERPRRRRTARWSSTSASARSRRRRGCRRSTAPSCWRRWPRSSAPNRPSRRPRAV